MRRIALILVFLGGCAASEPAPSADDGPAPMPGRVTCGDPTVPSFSLAVLSQPGGADPADDQPAAVLQAVIRESQGTLPEHGWIRAVETEDAVLFVARGGAGMAWSMVKFQLRDGAWQADAYGQCHLQPEIPDDVGIAVFRVAPGAEMTPETTEVNLLVTERACNSGEDARGRIRVLDIVAAADTVTVVLAVVPRPGNHTCPSNPETPFTLELPQPLGDRVLLDGSSVPARDATTCPDPGMCP